MTTMDAEEHVEAFTSLDALQVASDQLILSMPDDDAPVPSEADSEDTIERIQYFIKQAIATGAVLDDPADRRTAQALIDFWGSKSYGVARGSRSRVRRSWRPTQVLAPFDPATIETTVERADAMFAGFAPKEQDLARQILLRIVRLGTGGSASSAPVERTELGSFGKPERVNKVLEALLAAGVLVPTSEGGKQLVSLQYEALIRNWKPLRSWIEERTRFRTKVQFWDQNGHPSANLVSGGQADRALADYADLSATERAFIARSSSQSRKRNIFVGVAACLICVVSGYLYYGWYSRHEAEKEQARAAQEAEREQARTIAAYNAALYGSGTNLQPAFTYLAGKNLPIRAQNRDIAELNLTGLYGNAETPAAVDFVKSNLRDIKFDSAKLPFASFSEATITKSSFKNTSLLFARFDEAVISSTSFVGAELYRTLFDRARFSDVDFSSTDLRSTSFRQVKLQQDKTPNFTGTAWWLARGWTFKQIDKIDEDYGRDKLKEVKSYQEDLARNQKRVEGAEKPIDRAAALNDLAWTYAIYGIDLAAAREAADKAQAIFEQLRNDPAWAQDTYENLQDTLAYILLQQKDFEGAKLTLERVPKKLEREGETMFKYAIALQALAAPLPEPEKSVTSGRAITYLEVSLGERNYVPSHELYLLKKLLVGEFEKRLKTMLQLGED